MAFEGSHEATASTSSLNELVSGMVYAGVFQGRGSGLRTSGGATIDKFEGSYTD
jgi:hypothetical protein